MNLVKDINPNIFREYDLRGIYPEDITEDVAYTLGKSFGTYIKQFGHEKTVVGHDNRLSSPSLSEALIKGILETGIDVINLGLVTTPMYYFAKYHLEIYSGIMITASHNPKEYNGFKMSFSKVGNAYGEQIQAFREFTHALNFDEGKGTEVKLDLKNSYLKLLKNSVDFGSRKIKVVVDCGNGTGSIIIKDVLEMLPIEYELLYSESDGNFPNHHPDPSVASNMVDLGNKVRELKYDFGIGIDGDADRVGIVDENGKVIPTDLVMAIIYRYLYPNMKNKKALFDVKCSKALIDDLEEQGIEPIMYRTGNSYTNMKMQEGDFDFGGEYSGHIFFRDKFPGFDDGIYGGLRMIEILSYSDKNFSDLLEGIHEYYSTEEIKIAVTDETKFDIVEKVKEYALSKNYSIITLDGVRVSFDDGWALVRASNTGPNLTIRFEAISEERLMELQNEFINVIETSRK
ncbi:MAG: phosphomannomutase/phosphoglucomutase [Bacilli bacterium]|jgi:phosphomannomutase/phosphoglucomutase|nr:phosphomannomutase/phosphoglucomutase [Bacilli bacterium]